MQLTGANLGVAVLILTVMITPIMVAIIVNALSAVPRSWTEGSSGARGQPLAHHLAHLAAHRPPGDHRRRGARHGVARWARRSCSRWSSGGRGFAPNLLDGTTALFEPARPLAATIIHYYEDLSNPADGATLYAMAAVLLVSSALLSLAGWAAKQPLKRYGIRT